MNQDSSRFDFSARPKGEMLVWLTAAGLALGTLMVLGLLGLVLVEGVKVFWPSPVVEVQLRPDSPFAVRGETTLAGTVEKRRMRSNDSGEELQLFLGNKDAYGFGFHFVDLADVESMEQPAGVMVAERAEYGDAIGYPVALVTEQGTTIMHGDPDFFEQLDESLATVRDRRETIYAIEKSQIGAINRRMEHLRLERSALTDSAQGSPTADARAEALARIELELADLQADYEELADEARGLRRQQDVGNLTYRLPTGEERTLPLGAFIRYHLPNDMSAFDKVAFFGAEIGRFLTERPREANTEGGIFPAIFGTFVMTVLMSACVVPFGVLAAIYLREYARQGIFVRWVRVAVNNLAGVPSIVFGVFGLGFFVYFVGGTIDQLFFSERLPTATFGTGGILWASLTLALMTVPVVIVATEEALASVPRGVREASLACGASKWQTIQRVVLPVSAPGILTGLILAMARGAGEVAPLMLVGVVKLAPTLPIDGVFPFLHPERKFMHLGFHIYDLGFQSPDSEAARPMVFATTLLLIGLVILLNLGAILLRNRLRKRYASSSF